MSRSTLQLRSIDHYVQLHMGNPAQIKTDDLLGFSHWDGRNATPTSYVFISLWMFLLHLFIVYNIKSLGIWQPVYMINRHWRITNGSSGEVFIVNSS